MAFDVETAVPVRYEKAARTVAAEFCCPVNYNPQYLKILPAETIERDDDCRRSVKHHPCETKGTDYQITDLSGAECGEPGGNCC